MPHVSLTTEERELLAAISRERTANPGSRKVAIRNRLLSGLDHEHSRDRLAEMELVRGRLGLPDDERWRREPLRAA